MNHHNITVKICLKKQSCPFLPYNYPGQSDYTMKWYIILCNGYDLDYRYETSRSNGRDMFEQTITFFAP